MGVFWCAHKTGLWQNVVSIDEFGAGHTDDCGPNANENGRACIGGYAPTYAAMDAIRTYDINGGHFTPGGGQTITDIAWDLSNNSPHTNKLFGFKPGFATYSGSELQGIFESIGGVTGVICEVANAWKLPYNEANVHYHFVFVAAYDSIANPAVPKVLVCNGDRIPLPTGTGKPDWYELSLLDGAGVIGLIVVGGPVAPPTPPADVPGAIKTLDSALVQLGQVAASIHTALNQLGA